MEMEPPDVADDHSSASHQGPFFSSFLFLNAGLAALSFLAFICPSRLRRCQQQEDGGMAVLNALSAGVLVGCALAIIIPEGFAASCGGDKGHRHGDALVGLPLLGGYVTQVLMNVVGQRLLGGHSHHHHHYHPVAKQSPMPNGEEDNEFDIEAAAAAAAAELVECLGDGDDDDPVDRYLEIELSPLGGSGAPRSLTAATGGRIVTVRSPHRRHSSTSDTTGLLPLAAAGATHHYAHHHRHHQRHPGRPQSNPAARASRCCFACPFSTDFVGLLFHCLADGVALGASALSKSAALQWSVFSALSLHKLPTAFATGAYVHASLATPNTIPTTTTTTTSSSSSRLSHRPRGLPFPFLLHALAFALASPFAALATHAAGRTLATGKADTRTIGALLLFSGGSFLFVAVGHVAPEVLHAPHVRRPGPQGACVLLALLAGMGLVPLLAALAPEGEEGH